MTGEGSQEEEGRKLKRNSERERDPRPPNLMNSMITCKRVVARLHGKMGYSREAQNVENEYKTRRKKAQ